MSIQEATATGRREELLELAYAYILQHGLADVSLRPLAAQIGSSPRVLLYLFGNKEGLILWVEGYARSLADPQGPWGGFARETLNDWLSMLSEAQPPPWRDTTQALAERTIVLGLLRGALLDLLATGDTERTTQAVEAELEQLEKTNRLPAACP